MAALNTKFTQYFLEFEKTMMSEGGVYDTTIKGLLTSFNEFGLSVEEKSKLLAEAKATSLQVVQSHATQAALAIIKNEKEQELLDEQVKTETEQTTLVKNKGLTEIEQAELLKEQAELVEQQTLTETEQTKVVQEAINTQTAETAKKNEEKKKITRDICGYDDQLQIKSAEYHGNLASFAVNADSESAQDAITAFNEAAAKIEARIGQCGSTSSTKLELGFIEDSIEEIDEDSIDEIDEELNDIIIKELNDRAN